MRRRSFALVLGVAAVLRGTIAPGAAAAGNQPPVAVDDPAIPGCVSSSFGGAFPIPEDYRDPANDDWFAFTGACLPTANDTDPDGDPLTLELVGQPEHGEAMWLGSAPQFLFYRADPNWSTPAGDQPGGAWFSDEIHYRVSDGTSWSNTASFRIWLAPVNDPPTFTPGPSLIESTTRSPAVSVGWATDVSPGPYEDGQHVAFEVDTDTRNAPAMFAVLPEIDEQGVLTFTPGTEPGLATVTVTAKDDGGLHEWTTGSPWSDPPDDTSDPVTFQIVVLPNEAPFATDDQATVTEDTPTPVDVLANDGDWDGTGWDAPLTITGASGGTLGTPELVGSSVVYTPDPDATGDDTFTYTIQDADGHPASGTVHVTITPVNDDPVATDDTLTTAHGAGPATIDVLANDSDVDGDTLAVDGVGTAAHGTAALASGTVTYQPDPGYSGADTFDYGVADGHGGSATASVRVTVTANQAPSASDDALTVDEDVAGVVDVLANDSDAGGSKLSITGVTNGLRGSAALVDGGVAFTPSQDANGPD